MEQENASTTAKPWELNGGIGRLFGTVFKSRVESFQYPSFQSHQCGPFSSYEEHQYTAPKKPLWLRLKPALIEAMVKFFVGNNCRHHFIKYEL